MRILVLVDWKVHYLEQDSQEYQPANKLIKGHPYWFFKYWPGVHQIDVIDFSSLPLIHAIEKHILKTYIMQTLKSLPGLSKYDLIISHGARSALLLSFMQSALKRNDPPHIHIDVGCFNGGRDHRRIETRLIKRSARGLSAIIYHSRIQKEYYQRNLPNLVDNCFYVPFGYDTDFFSPLDEKIGKSIVSIGYDKRDYPTLIKAWSGLKAKETKLKIVGVANPEVFRYVQDPFPTNIDFLPVVPILELKKLIARSIFIVLPLPYLKQSYGQKTLLESMAMKKAVIVTKTPSTEDYINDFKTGVFVEPYDAEDLAKKINMLLKSNHLTKTIAINAEQIARNSFTAQRMSERLYGIVTRILKERP